MLKFIFAVFFFGCLFSASYSALAQTGTLEGKVRNADGESMELATVGILETGAATATGKTGRFSLQVPAGKAITVQISFVGYTAYQKSIQIQNGQTIYLDVTLQKENAYLQQVEISHQRDLPVRDQVSITKINARETRLMPSAFGDFNKVLATLPGVVSNNELSSTYSVRGGNFDENLIYVDNIEIYRPNLVSNGQQEGLSFVNPDMVADVEFSSGGWQPKYGDKLSSVLNIKYKRPVRFGGTATASLTGGSLQLEGASKNKRFSWNTGVRHKNAVYVFQFLPVQGNYRPKFSDLQSYLTYDISTDSAGKPAGKTIVGLLASFANNDYRVAPETGEASFGTINQVLRVNIAFAGRDLVNYNTFQGGVSVKHQFSSRFSSEFIGSMVYSREREFKDVESAYRFCEVNTDPTSSGYNQCINEREVGSTFEHSRNTLLARIAALENRSTFNLNQNHSFEGGFRVANENLKDEVLEYAFLDSTDYVINTTYLGANNTLESQRISAYLQHTWRLDSLKTLTYGTRASYWTLNEQTVISPRAQFAFRTANKPNLIYKVAAGVYHQPPFYRELRDRQGNINRALKAQQSIHAIVGADYLFKAWGRDFKFRGEAYFKYITNVIPYDVENVRIRYFANNRAKAYATGIDMRVNGEFIEGAESWFSLGLLRTRENVEGDSMVTYAAQNGQVVPVDTVALGYIRRPSDQFVTLGVFFQDQLPNNPSVKMYLNGLYGSGLVTGIPGNTGSRGSFGFPSYFRLDIGFSKLITFREEDAATKTGFLQSLWLGAEILNIIAASNTISYSFVRDYDNRQYAVPNTLTGRIVNIRMVARF